YLFAFSTPKNTNIAVLLRGKVAEEKTYVLEERGPIAAKIADYVSFTKFRLAALVVFSAGIGYLTAINSFEWGRFLWFLLGGFLVTASSDGFNQIMERD